MFKRLLSVILIYTLVFSTYATPLALFAESQTNNNNSDFTLIAFQNGDGVELSWELNQLENGSYEEFLLVKNNQTHNITNDLVQNGTDGTTLSYTFTDFDISPDSTYDYQVIVNTDNGEQLVSNTTTILIESTEDDGSHDENEYVYEEYFLELFILEKGEDFIEVEWAPANNEVSHYLISLDNNEPIMLEPNITTYRFENLAKGAWYTIKLEAFHHNGKSFSESVRTFIRGTKDVQIKVINATDNTGLFRIYGLYENGSYHFSGTINDDGFLYNGNGNNTFTLYTGSYEVYLQSNEYQEVFIINIVENLDYEEPIILDLSREVIEVDIPDENLKRAIYRELGLNDNEIITNIDMERLQYLYASGYGIKDLTGLEYAKNLKYVDLADNNIYTLNPLRDLEHLVELNIFYSVIKDIDSLLFLINKGVNVDFYNEDYNFIEVIDQGDDYIEIQWEVLLKDKVSNYTIWFDYDEQINVSSDTKTYRFENLEQRKWYNIELKIEYTNGTNDYLYLNTYVGKTNQIQFNALNVNKTINSFSIIGQDDINHNYYYFSNGSINEYGYIENKDGISNFDLPPGLYKVTIFYENGGEEIFVVRTESDANDEGTIILDFGRDVFEVTIPDEGLKEAIKDMLMLDKDKNITNVDLERLRFLNAEGYGIEDLSGLEYAVNLRNLYLHNNNSIHSLKPLENLAYLELVDIYNSYVLDTQSIITLLNRGINVWFNNDDYNFINVIEQGQDYIEVEWNLDLLLDEVAQLYVIFDRYSFEVDTNTETYRFEDLEKNKWYNIELEIIYENGDSEYIYTNTYLGDTKEVHFKVTNTNEYLYFYLEELYNHQFHSYGSVNEEGYLENGTGSTNFDLAPGLYKVALYHGDVRTTFIVKIEIDMEYNQPIILDFNREIIEVEIPDKGLEQAIRDTIWMEDDEVITNVILEELVYLYADYYGIEELTGLEYATNLRMLELSGNQLTDLSILQNLSNLQVVYFFNNTIDDIETIQYLLDKGIDVYFDPDSLLELSVIEMREDYITFEFGYKFIEQVESYELYVNYQDTIVLDKDSHSYTFNNLSPNEWFYVGIAVNLKNGDIVHKSKYIYLGDTKEVQIIVENINLDQEYRFTAREYFNYGYSFAGHINNDGLLVSYSGDEVFDIAPGFYYLWIENMNTGKYEEFFFEIDQNGEYLLNPIILDNSRIGEEVAVEDSVLESIIREMLDIYDRSLTTVDFEKITYLGDWSINNKIQSLHGIEHAKYLVELILFDDNITDISPLSNLKYLRWLFLNDQKISDITPLSSLNNLNHLYLDGNNITNIDALEQLHSLEYLNLSNNPINDISVLTKLPNLREVYLYNIAANLEPGSLGANVIEELRAKGVIVRYNENLQLDLYTWVEEVTDSSISLKWLLNNDGNIIEYILTVNDNYYFIDISENSFVIEGLEPNQVYDIAIVAINMDGEELLSRSHVVTTAHSPDSYTKPKISVLDDNGDLVTDRLEFLIDGIEGDTKELLTYGFVGSDGTLKVRNNPNNELELLIGKYELIIFGNENYQSKVSTIEVTKDGEIKVILSKVTNETIDLKLNIVDPNGNPINSVNYISLRETVRGSNANHYVVRDVSNKEGLYVLEDVLFSDNYRLSVKVDGFVANDMNIVVNRDTTVINVVMDRGLTIKGTIKDQNSNPLIADYQIYMNEYGYLDFGKTNAGAIEITGVKKENLIITFSLNGFKSVTKEISVNDAIDDIINLDVVLESNHYIHGKILKEDGTAARNITLYLVDKNGFRQWSSTNQNGYFRFYVDEGTEYILVTDAYNLPNVEITLEQNEEEYEIILISEGEGDFTGEGNGFASSLRTVSQGQVMDYRFNYKNNGDAVAEDVSVTFELSDFVSIYGDTLAVYHNGQRLVEGTDYERFGKRFIVYLDQADEGTINFRVKVNDDVEDTIISKATIDYNEQQQTYVATTSVIFVTINGPEVISKESVTLYGNARSGAKVTIYDGNTYLGETRVEYKQWFLNVDLPVRKGGSTHYLVAVVEDSNRNIAYSEPLAISYEPDIPSISKVNISAGWNQDMTLNPNLGVVTAAIVEFTQIDIEVEFDDSTNITDASIMFLGEEHKLRNLGSTYKATIPGTWSSFGEQMLDLKFNVGDREVKVPLMNVIVLIDPSGYVFEGSMDNRLPGVKAVVEERVGEDWVEWDAEFYGQINPQITDERGRYGWDVIEGDWRVIFTKDGYHEYISRIVTVPPAETELNVPLVKVSNPIVESITPQEGTTNVEIDSTVEIVFDRLMDQSNIVTGIQVFKDGVLVNGIFTFENYEGYEEYMEGYFRPNPNQLLSQTVLWTPDNGFDYNATYTVVISDKIRDYSGKSLEEEVIFIFTTEESTKEPEPGDVIEGKEPSTGGDGNNESKPDDEKVGTIIDPDKDVEGKEDSKPTTGKNDKVSNSITKDKDSSKTNRGTDKEDKKVTESDKSSKTDKVTKPVNKNKTVATDTSKNEDSSNEEHIGDKDDNSSDSSIEEETDDDVSEDVNEESEENETSNEEEVSKEDDDNASNETVKDKTNKQPEESSKTSTLIWIIIGITAIIITTIIVLLHRKRKQSI